MPTLRRLTGLLLMGALVQLTLGASAYCVSEDMASAGMSHDDMSMPANGSSHLPGQGQPRHPADSPAVPCEHGFQGTCATMTSCATLAIVMQTATAVPAVERFSAVDSTATMLATLTVAPDTPPPRV